MMTDEVIFREIVNVVRPYARNQATIASATPETSMLSDLNVNSARLVDIILGIEDKFGIQLDDAAADSVVTIGDAVRAVASRLPAAG